MIDYNWILDVQKNINASSLFGAGIVGAKSLAMAFLLFKIMGHFLSTAENSEKPPIGGLINIIGFGLIIVGSDFIITTIESLFSNIDIDVASMNNANTISPAKKQLDFIAEQTQDLGTFETIDFYFSIIDILLGLILTYFCSLLFHFIDVAVTSMYLLQRVFLIQLFRFIFPLAIAFSTLDKMSDMLWRWIKIYMGLFILGIAYIGIVKFSVVVYDTLYSKIDINNNAQLNVEMASIMFADLGILLIVFCIKIGLMSIVTREIRGYFN